MGAVHQHHHEELVAGAQVGAHDAGHRRVPGVQQQGRRQPLQERLGQRQRLGGRVQQAHQGRCAHQGQRGAEAANPSAGTQRGARRRLRSVTPARAQCLRDDDANPGANEPKEDEERARDMVGQREGRARAVRQAPCQRRADDTDANAQQQLQQQRPGQCEKSRRGCGRRAVQGVQAGAENAAPTFTIAASCSAALLPRCCRRLAALLPPSCYGPATGPLPTRYRPAARSRPRRFSRWATKPDSPAAPVACSRWARASRQLRVHRASDPSACS